MKRKILIVSAVVLVISVASAVYYLTVQDDKAPTSQKPTTKNTELENTQTSNQPSTDQSNMVSAKAAPAKPVNATATAEGVIAKKDTTYSLKVDGAPKDLTLDLSQYSGNIDTFVNKKVKIELDSSSSAGDGTTTIVAKKITLAAN